MAVSIPKFQNFITVEAYRELVQKHFQEKLEKGELYDARDIQRFNENDRYAEMFLQHGQFGSTFNEQRALHSFDAAMSWRKRHQVYDISTKEFPERLFDRRVLYFQNHDRFEHRILYFVVRAFVPGEEDSKALKRFITYTFEEHLRQYPGQKIVILFDTEGAGLRNLDYDMVKFIIASAQIFYPGLLAYMLIYKMPFLLSAAWKLIRGWITPEADQFVKFVDRTSITGYVAPDQLPVRMGGTSTGQNESDAATLP